MDLQAFSDEPKFYKFFFTPTKHMYCGLFTLRTGSYLIIAIDILVAIWSIFQVYPLLALELYLIEIFNPATLIVLVVLLEVTVNIVCGILGVVCIQGLKAPEPQKVHYYAKLKLYEFPLKTFRETFAMIFYCDDFYDTCHPFALMVIWIITFCIRIYLTYVIWSADVRLQNNETVLVLHGEQVLDLMEQQAANLAYQGQIIAAPGEPVQPIYQAELAKSG